MEERALICQKIKKDLISHVIMTPFKVFHTFSPVHFHNLSSLFFVFIAFIFKNLFKHIAHQKSGWCNIFVLRETVLFHNRILHFITFPDSTLSYSQRFLSKRGNSGCTSFYFILHHGHCWMFLRELFETESEDVLFLSVVAFFNKGFVELVWWAAPAGCLNIWDFGPLQTLREQTEARVKETATGVRK